jgi:hypothetical protein
MHSRVCIAAAIGTCISTSMPSSCRLLPGHICTCTSRIHIGGTHARHRTRDAHKMTANLDRIPEISTPAKAYRMTDLEISLGWCCGIPLTANRSRDPCVLDDDIKACKRWWKNSALGSSICTRQCFFWFLPEFQRIISLAGLAARFTRVPSVRRLLRAMH